MLSITTHPVHSPRRGVSLAEMAVVVIIIAVMLGWTIPRYFAAIEQSRVDMAGSKLVLIYTAERLYSVLNNGQYATVDQLVAGNFLDQGFAANVDPFYEYTAVPLGAAPSATFTATAQRLSGDRWAGSLTITQAGALTGTITDSSLNITLTPANFALGM